MRERLNDAALGLAIMVCLLFVVSPVAIPGLVFLVLYEQVPLWLAIGASGASVLPTGWYVSRLLG